ncbi:MAG TPA: hypothetical protein VKZ65_03175 [Glycomyces sp.]|nr:hypothetical protein [Glycomyces sp.]
MPTKDDRGRQAEEPENTDELQEWTEDGPPGGRTSKPDVYLDVPQVDVEELIIDVEDLRARVSLSVEVLDLVRLNVGADVALGKVHLDLKGVHAQATLKVRLNRVAEIVTRVLETVDRNPQVLEHALSAVESTVKPVAEGGANALGAAGTGVAGALEHTGEGLGGAVRSAGEGVGGAVRGAGEGVGGAVRGAGEGVGEGVGGAVRGTAADLGDTVRGAGAEAGEVLESAPETAERAAGGAAAAGEGEPAAEEAEGRGSQRQARKRTAAKKTAKKTAKKAAKKQQPRKRAARKRSS